ncbi:MAG: GNAT family N-acetyltransferase [Chloroflexi bacterium]|nr:GNAT family N-acetyltransferase [Chloroflexota bacterium]
MDIRNYQSTDAIEIARLFDEFQDYFVTLDPLHRLRRLPGYGAYMLQQTLEDVARREGVFYVAVEQDVVAGFAVGLITRSSPGELLGLIPSSRGIITELYVSPPYRRQGIGTKLMRETEQYFIRQGCDAVRVSVFVPNQMAHSLYLKLGYRDRDIEMIKPI